MKRIYFTYNNEHKDTKVFYVTVGKYVKDGKNINENSIHAAFTVPVSECKKEFNITGLNGWEFTLPYKYFADLTGFDDVNISDTDLLRPLIADIHNHIIKLETYKHKLLNLL